MKIPMIFCNRETAALCLAFQSAIRHLKIGFRELGICLIFAIPRIFITVLDLLSRGFKKRII
ncbi:hypothetical protein KAX02_00585 [candidate division WOR-3 bacterium]|nr:hypothetical protein [candidate division WOR-3 bacterium]